LVNNNNNNNQSIKGKEGRKKGLVTNLLQTTSVSESATSEGIMSRITRTICFSELHYNLVTSLCKTYRLGFSEVVRRLIDSGLDHDATLGLSFHEERLKSLRSEVAAVETTIEGLRAEFPISPETFGETRTCNSVTSKPKTEHDDFLHHINNLGCGGKLGELATKKVKGFLVDHADWDKDIPVDKRHLLIEQEGSP
jgi:hypothetical protein